jgi:hypothetical protein
MTLTDKDILQIDASVVTGLLIFLTLSFVSIFSIPNVGPGRDIIRCLPPGIPPYVASLPPDEAEPIVMRYELAYRFLNTSAMLTPFAISAIILLVIQGEGKIRNKVRKAARFLTALGFGMILIIVIIVGMFILPPIAFLSLR